MILYLDAVVDTIGTQIRSSNPINIEQPDDGDRVIEENVEESENNSFVDSEYDCSDGDKDEDEGDGDRVADRDEGDQNVDESDSTDLGQPKGTRLKRLHYMVKCGFCGETGHNQKSCQIRKEAEEFVASLEAEDLADQDSNEANEGQQTTHEKLTARKRTSAAGKIPKAKGKSVSN
ncbi:hypothetical protein Salat_0860300 [Sesamum alatum]|uniref:CCHC-type domain-containing protein n=1 Tax=Sesamum alatum TaxID=300844 RepID=A0AAE2CQP6_9LAMI|nr:hypothetical protein Salat_0860300 [Sesamum alatum]